MSEFLPEDATPHRDAGTSGVTPLQDITAPPAPPPYAPAGSPPPPPCGHAALPSPNATWGGAPPTWNPAPVKKRKAWPWVFGIVGALVVLGGASAVIILGVAEALNGDQNDAYVGDPITAADAPTIGDQLLISEDGTVAFDIGSEWVDAATFTDLSGLGTDYPEGASIMGAYFTFDPTVAADAPPSLVFVIEGAEFSRVGAVYVRSAHDDFMEAAFRSLDADGVTVKSTGPEAVTTSNGLDGFVSTVSAEYQGGPVRSYVYTFARGKRVVFVWVFSSTTTFDHAAAALVTDSLRIDK